MSNKTFKEDIIDLLKDMFISLLEAIKMTLMDFKSFRNRLVGYICILTLLLILSKNSQIGAQVASLGILGTVISYYFKQRNDSAKNEKDSTKTKEDDK